MDIFDTFGIAIGKAVIKFRWLCIAVSLLAVMSAGYGAQFLGFDTNYRVFFSKDNPQLNAFEQLQRVYSKTDNAIFVLKPKSGDVFSPNVLKAVQELTEESWQLPYSTRVDSLTNFQHTYAEGDDLTVVDLVEGNPETLSKDELEAIRDIALNEPLLVGRTVSLDGNATGVNIIFHFPEKHPFEVPETVAVARDLLANIQAKYPEIEMRASGVVFMNNAFSESSQMDLQTLIPLMYGLLIAAMILFLRSISGTIATLFVIAFSAVTAMGLAGYFGVRLTPPSSTAPTVILTLAIADSIHIIVSMLKEMQYHGRNKQEAIIESLRINLQPVFLTSITTIVGFLSLNFSDAPPFHDLGNITAVGIAAAFVYSIFLLPALLSILPIQCKVRKEEHKGGMDKLGDFVVKFRVPLLVVSLSLLVFLGSMISRIELNDQFVQYFDESISFRPDSEFLMENLTGIYLVEYSLNSKGASGISDPEYLRYVEAYTDWLREQDEVVHVYSMSDIFKRLNKNMHGDDSAWYRLPDSKEMAAQYLLLYEFSLPYGLDLNDRINVDKSATRLTATLKDMSTIEIREFKHRSESWIRDNLPVYMHTEATSPVVMFAYISERNINSMMKGNILALLVISLIILIVLRSVKIGLFSLIPNLTPAIFGFGIWGVLVGEVNMAVAIVAAVSLGIIVDDTVHFLSKYFRARREKGLDSHNAVRYAFSTVGTALLVTTFVLVIGFSVLVFSGFKMNTSLGLLTAIIISCALFADFFLLPPLLMLLERKRNISESGSQASSQSTKEISHETAASITD